MEEDSVSSIVSDDACTKESGANQVEIAPEQQNVSLEYLEPEVRKKLEDVIKSKGITDYTLTIEPGSSVGDNYMGFLGKVTIVGLDKNKEKVTLNWMIKTAPINDLFRTAMNIELLYRREVYMYETLFPKFSQFQEEKSILEPFNNHPTFVYSHMEPMQESFVMENLKHEGYVMRNRHEPLNWHHVKVLMKTYAKFHAVSLAMKDQKPEEFALLANNMKDVISVSHTNPDVFKMILDPALQTLDEKADKPVLKKFIKFYDNFMDISNTAVNMTNRYSVMGHGDSWVNNMLWKYDDLSNQTIPTRACLLDFQLARYGSPVCDLSYFLFTCTDKSLRDKHYDDAIRLYYYTLCGYLNELGSDPEKVFPFSVLEMELKRFSVVGMFWSLMVLYNITRDTDEIPDMKDGSINEEELTKQFTKKSKNHDKYAKRVKDVICDCCHKGYLDFLQ